jgi:hypothetical protein
MGGKRYFLTCYDQFSHHIDLCFLANKFDALAALKEFSTMAETQKLKLAGKSSKSDQMEVGNSIAMQQQLSIDKRGLNICLNCQDHTNKMVELKGFTLQSSNWFGPISRIVYFHLPSEQKRHHMRLIHEIKHPASHQTVFQMIYGMARRDHSFTYNPLAAKCTIVDMKPFQSWTLATTKVFF